jgi:hypothetical protein
MKSSTQRVIARSGKGYCAICDQQTPLVLHHIWGRKIQGWNNSFNEVWLCPNCHYSVHSPGGVVIEGWVMTTKGKILSWHRQGEQGIIGVDATPYQIGGKK